MTLLLGCSLWNKCYRKFCRKYPNVAVPSKLIIYKLVAKFCATTSVIDKKKTKERHILTKEKLDKIGACLEAGLKKSLC
jgi:hypothetical protein